MINELINVTELSKVLSGNNQSIRKKKVPAKYNAAVQELNDLLEYWKKRHNL
ncbi:hypothetical protein [Myroides odoratus]|uniref:hypothetical protein n=1 Tax=Myroides odoratus TaxID=256 RepID=UPI000A411BE4|nr:hypothetical protein [Myroides odoratus]